MTGHSLMTIFKSGRSGQIERRRNHVLTGKERHTPAQIDHMGGTPMRAIRTRDYLYIHNFEPERWPAGDPDGSMRGPALSDIDDSPTKRYIVHHKNDPDLKKYYQLSCGKRPPDELYDLKKDPHQLNNVASDPSYKSILKDLKSQLMEELSKSEDPRLLGRGDAFDSYPYLGRMEQSN